MFYLDTHNILYLGSCLLASVCTLCICRNRELFPHISENKPIGQLYRLMNIHKYESFSIIIQIHHLNLKFGDDDNAKFIVHLKIGNRYAYTHYHKQYQNKVHIEERKNMVVKQNNNTLRLEVYKKGTLKNTFFGSAEIHIYSEIVKKLFPCNVYFNITNKNQIVGTACLSFHYINLDCIKKDDQIYTSLFIETIISVQKNQTKNNEKIEKLIDEGKEHFEAIKETDLSTTIYKNISNLVLEDKIRLFCKNLNGYLLHSNFYIKRFYNKYYFYLHFFKGKFYWCYYNEEADAKMDKNRVGYVRLEYVANVYSDVYSHKYFYIKYRKKNERKENYLYLKTIDKDRNIWVNIIHDFIILVSNYKRERKNKKYKIKEFKDNLIEDTPKEILEINKTLSRSLSNNSMKNKYLDKKKKVEVLSDMDNEENYMNSGDLGPVFKDMSKNMYNYSD
ncbi:hypothetical protein PFMG_02936 [Plasmodium falciparum IGH-CR14]|uniref:Rhoptry surface protein CERLI1 n=8 Tax=Plasmodium falciparum TaxID=5833 RepID=CERI1_PLAF7|nr:conserved protein, unknown function [Plasmodium falciparum 3D7]ETW38938.1 hypothetical protein PFTANZ_00282 [Plasmodium falciparum Tanzania (2000708)]ETW51673.1 hypothetical protein PFMALIP_00253 [Plasmodium falciparum MaliPS096_E11]ETW57802.1 hypothetical protein PFUGPA_00252 [Plasmodium falciparum Palo Alto/Uganda]KAF4331362.1 hypothetical protein CYL21_0177 [Plasmodium falciparum NF54]KNG76905.1 hypothetical protein PFMG_02936 [Plasmodium falciparum IGH-CR14]SOS76282.1 conserved Plasmod|eukprot:XP_001349613.1 conserved Plasmodium protein, unknown function [Plasmodium falciparum 3D7]